MKVSMKRIVPILLALLIVASLVWYCAVYDPDFTRDILLQQARYHSTHGNARLASFFYDLVYEHSGQDENIAIELANQFKAAGNYTKAEYTLTNAIANGGTVELYVALSKVYVEQNKLLDAVNMLDSIPDAEVKAQLDAMRPAAPAGDPEPGFYSQYISVTLTGESGTVYCTTNGEYPSIDDVPYSEPITLPGGETTIRAITVADNGLVSPLATLGYTIGGVIEQVSFADPAIEAAVREQLSLDSEDPIYTDQLWTITDFTVPAEAEALSDLSQMTYLESLTVQDKSTDSLDFLSALTQLQSLDLSGSRFPAEELATIAALTQLQSLNLSDCGLSTLAGLEGAQGLISLDLSNNTVRNLEPLAAMSNLEELYLQHNAVTSLSDLSALTNLYKLDVSYNSLTSAEPIASCVNLTWLDISENALTSLSGIDNLVNLTYFAASNNDLTDVSSLSVCIALTELRISGNALTDISALAALTSLEVLDFSYNEIIQLPAWPDGCPLRIIDGSYNAVESLSALSNMQQLTHVYMDYNAITSVEELKNCTNLVLVNVYGNVIADVKMLTDQDVIVNYDPTLASTTETE